MCIIGDMQRALLANWKDTVYGKLFARITVYDRLVYAALAYESS
jgi:hypothetical protein